ncbi:MAG: divalent cation tolerance protein CutA [Luteitalea sp.]|nr:divalent cation tolerance protein CutA [Luteitalea sp.]
MVIDEVVIVLTTIPDAVDEVAFAEALVRERLAACVSVLPAMQSTYRWQGNVERSRERQVLVKTVRSRLDALHEAVRARHPYEVPEWLVLSSSGGSDAYLGWVRECASG